MTDSFIIGGDSANVLPNAIKALCDLDLSKKWRVEIKKYQKRRSLDQNALYWKWVGIIADDTGNDPDELHEFLKRKFLQPRPVEIAGEVDFIYSTRRLSTAEMSEYMNRVEAFAGAELGIVLPHPEDMHATPSASAAAE